jgi:hypothetical protein
LDTSRLGEEERKEVSTGEGYTGKGGGERGRRMCGTTRERECGDKGK